jgi:HK97 family phage major capsid protein
MTNKGKKYLPNVMLMNPIDVLLYKLKKGNDGQYVLPPFIDQNGKVIDGMTVVESNQVAADTILAGDFRFGTVFDLEDTLIELGFIDKQFVQDTMTLKATKRTALLVRNVDADAFRSVVGVQAALDVIGPVA